MFASHCAPATPAKENVSTGARWLRLQDDWFDELRDRKAPSLREQPPVAMKDPVFPVFAALGTVLVLLPLTWHARTGNIAMVLLIIWIALANFIQFVNTVIWYSNVDNKAPVWCDISTRLYLMSIIAVPACNLCIAVRLESIASTREVVQTASAKKRQKIFELTMGILLPLVYVALAVVWQG